MTSSHRHEWPVVREHIKTRMAQLRLSIADLSRASGISDKHLRTLLNGTDVAVPQDKTRWALCDGLGWTQDSIDRILDGDEPLVAGDESGEISRLDQLDGRVAEIEAVQTTGLGSLRNQQTEMAKFWKLLQRLEGDVRRVESELAELRQAQRPGDAGQP